MLWCLEYRRCHWNFQAWVKFSFFRIIFWFAPTGEMIVAMVSGRRCLRFLASRRSGRIGRERHDNAVNLRGRVTSVLTADGLRNSGFGGAWVEAGRPRHRGRRGRSVGRRWIRRRVDVWWQLGRDAWYHKTAAQRGRWCVGSSHQSAAATHEIVQLDKRRRRRRRRRRRHESIAAVQRRHVAENSSVADHVTRTHIVCVSAIDKRRCRAHRSTSTVGAIRSVGRRIPVERSIVSSGLPGGAERGGGVVAGPAVVDRRTAVDVNDARSLLTRGSRSCRSSRRVDATRHGVISGSGRLLPAHTIDNTQQTVYHADSTRYKYVI